MEKTKICTTCEEEKTLSYFSPRKAGKHGKASICKNCFNKKYNNKGSKYKYIYGITLEEAEAIKNNQNHKCAICSVDFDKLPARSIHLDHCHTTSKVRGFLCHHCNSLLGYSRDNIKTLENAIKYLRG